jgi:hypothetical protein
MMAKGHLMKIFALTVFLAATAPSQEFWHALTVASWNEAAGHFVYSAGGKIIAPTNDTEYPYVVISRITGDFVLLPASTFAVERAATYDKAAARAAATGGRVTTAADGAILVYYRK